jgi:hypothetical protein
VLNRSAGVATEKMGRSTNTSSQLIIQVELSSKNEDIRRNFPVGLRQEQIPEKICQRAATITMLRLKINPHVKQTRKNVKVYGEAGGQQ